MSTLRVSTLQDTAGSNSSTPAAIANGIAKAWVNFNGTGTVAIRASYNVSSITDNGTGNYTLNFTNAFADANYAWAGSAAATGNGGTDAYISYGMTATYPVVQSTTQLRVLCMQTSNSPMDSANVNVAIFR